MKYVDLFCGAGGASTGLVRAGWECVGAVDYDEGALSIYAANHPTHPVHRLDLSQPLDSALTSEWRAALQEDGALWASSPCTDFSTAGGVNRGFRAALTATLADHVRAVRPMWLLFENVPRAQHSPEFANLVASLEAEGYAVAHGVVDARGANLPQARKRLIMIASRARSTSSESAAHRAHRSFCESMALGSPPTMRACFASAGAACPQPYIYLQACNEKNRKSVFTVDGPAPTVRTILRPMRATYPFPPRDDTHDPSLIFAATPAHIAALQGFPPDYDWCNVPKTARARYIGNAVPPPVSEKLARVIE